MLSSYLEIVWKEWANFNVQRLLLGFWLPTTNEHLLLNYFKKPPPYALKRLLLGYDYLSLSEQLESITLFIISWLFLPAAFLLHLFQYIPIVKHFTQVLQIFLVILCRSIVRLIKECLIMLFWEEKPRLLLLGLSLAVVFAPFYLPYFGVTGLVVGTSYYIFTGLISLGMGLLCLFTNKIKLALAKVPDFPARLLVWLEGDAAEFQVRLIGEVGQHYYQRMSDSKDQAAELHWAYNKGGLLVLQRHKEVYLSERSEFNDGHLLLVPGDKEGVTIRHPNKNNQTTVNVRCEKDNYFLKFSGDKHWISCGPQDVWDQLERRDFRDVVKSIAHCPRVRRDQGHYYVDHPTSEVKGPFKTLREANQHLKALDEDTRRLALLSPDIYLATFLNPGDRLPLIGGGELCFDSSNTPPRVIKKVEAAVHNYDFSSPRRTSLEVGHSRAIEDEEKLDASVDYSTSNRSSLSEKDLQVRTKTSGRVYSPFSGSLLAVQKIVKRLKKKQPHLEEYLEGIEQMVMWVEQYPRRQGFIADLKSELFELLNKEIPQEILQISQKSREIRLDIHQDIQEGRFEKALESIEKYQDEMAWLVKAQAAICLRPFFMKEHFQALRAYIISDQGVFETHRVIHDELLQMAKQIEDSVVRDNIMAHIEQGQFDRAIKSIVAYEGRVMSGRLKALLEAALVAKGNLAAMPLLNDTTSAIILRLIDKQAYMSARLVLAISSSSVFRESEHERVLVELASIVDASDDETIYNAIEDLCNQEKAYVLIAEIIDYMEQGKSLKEIQDHTFIHRYHSLLNRLPEDHPKRCTLQIMMAKWKAQCLSESLLPVSLQEAKGAINEFKERPNWRERLEEVERMIFWIMLDPQLSMESLKKELSKLLNEEIPDAVVQQNESYKKIKSDIRRCIDRGRFAEAIRSIVTLVSPQVADMVHACERLKQQISKLAPYCLAHTFKRQLVQLDSIIGHCQFPHSNNLEMAHVLFKEWETFTEASLRILVCELKKLWVALPYEPNIENLISFPNILIYINHGQFDKALRKIELYYRKIEGPFILARTQLVIQNLPFFTQELFQKLSSCITSDKKAFEMLSLIRDELSSITEQVVDEESRGSIYEDIEQNRLEKAIKRIVVHYSRIMECQLRVLLEAVLVEERDLVHNEEEVMPFLKDTIRMIVLQLIDKKAYASARLLLEISDLSIFREPEYTHILEKLVSIVGDDSDDKIIYDEISNLYSHTLTLEMIEAMTQGKPLEETQKQELSNRGRALLKCFPKDHTTSHALKAAILEWEEYQAESLTEMKYEKGSVCLHGVSDMPDMDEVGPRMFFGHEQTPQSEHSFLHDTNETGTQVLIPSPLKRVPSDPPESSRPSWGLTSELP